MIGLSVGKNCKSWLRILCLTVLPFMVLTLGVEWNRIGALARTSAPASLSTFELVQKRSPNSKTFDNFDGTRTTRFYSQPVHYLDQNGSYQEINTAIKNHQVTQAPFKAEFGDSWPKLSFEREGTSLEFLPQGVSPTQGRVEQNQIIYQDAFLETDFRYIVQSRGVKEEIILKNSQAPTSFTFEVVSNHSLPEVKSNSMDFDSFTVPAPVAYDAQGNQGPVVMTSQMRDGKSYLTLTVDPAWLATARYPVVIDPTLQTKYPPVVEDTCVGSGAGAYKGDSIQMKVQKDSCTALVRFNLNRPPNQIPPGSYITDAGVALYRNSSGTSVDIRVRQITSYWQETTANPAYGGQTVPTYGAVASNTLTIPGSPGWPPFPGEWTVTTLVQDWVLGRAPNYGMAFEAVSSGSAIFNSRNAASNHPDLVVTYIADTTSPQSVITQPKEGSFIKGSTYTIRGKARDNDGGTGIQKVEVSIDDGPWQSVTGYDALDKTSWYYNWALPADGSRKIESRATDVEGNIEPIIQSVNVTVDKTLPTAQLTSPTGNQTFTGTDADEITFEGRAADTNFKQYKLEYGPVGGGGPWTQMDAIRTTAVDPVGTLATIDTSRINGSYSFQLVVEDQAGNKGYAQVDNITLDNPEASTINPHGTGGGYTQDTDACAACHATHTAIEENLLTKPIDVEAEFCYSCHNGLGSIYNIKSDVDSNPSHHPIKDNKYPGAELTCSTCHSVHGDKDEFGNYYAKLLRVLEDEGPPPQYIYKGNDFCWVCHGETTSEPAGDHKTGYPSSAHSAVYPVSGTEVSCNSCHVPHGSQPWRLTKGEGEEDTCYECHNNPSNSERGWNIQNQFGLASHHDITSLQPGAKVECTSCHGPHIVTQSVGQQTSDPENTKLLWGDGGGEDTTTFCLKCHDGTPPNQSIFSTDEVVPYTVEFPPILGKLTNQWYQTDWSGGDGQDDWAPGKYSSGDKVDVTSKKGTIELSTGIGGSNYLSGMTYTPTVSPDSPWEDTVPPSKFTDEVLSTTKGNSFGYYQEPSTVQINFDFGTSRSGINSAIFSSGGGEPVTAIAGRRIRLSSNGFSWTDVVPDAQPSQPHEVFSFASQSARYTRFEFRWWSFSGYDWMFVGEGAVGQNLSISAASSGWLESSTYDTGEFRSGVGLPNYDAISWEADVPSGSQVRFRIATSNEKTGPWVFRGPDGATDSYYGTSGQSIYFGHDGQRYIRYKVYLNANPSGQSPTLKNITIKYNTAYEASSILAPFFPGWDKSVWNNSLSAHGPGIFGANLQCSKCHHPHGSQNPRLTAYFNGSTYDNTSAKLEQRLCQTSGCHPTISVHDAANEVDGVHSDTEGSANFAYSAIPSENKRHAECVDCHDPHQALIDFGIVPGPPNRQGVLNGAGGVTIGGEVISSVDYEYQVCLKCHSSFTTLKSTSNDMIEALGWNSLSWHPVARPGANWGVRDQAFTEDPTKPWNPGPGDDPDYGDYTDPSDLYIYCTDCHDPHDNGVPYNLKNGKQLTNSSNSSTYFCYECHDYNTYYNGADTGGSRWGSPFTPTGHAHNKSGMSGNTCMICHNKIHGTLAGNHLSTYLLDNTNASGTCSVPGCHTMGYNTPTGYYHVAPPP